jgi:type II secretory pathway pseudopilin PulG
MTLLEAVVALAIIGLAGIAALATVGTELRGAARARQAIEAAALAEEQMARVGLLAGAELSSLPDSVRAGSFPGRLEEYRWTATSRSLPGEPDTYGVTVEVTWPDGGHYALETRWFLPRTAERGP